MTWDFFGYFYRFYSGYDVLSELNMPNSPLKLRLKTCDEDRVAPLVMPLFFRYLKFINNNKT